MGWTFSNRNDSAIIANPDQQVRYVLVIFGDDPKYYEDIAVLGSVKYINPCDWEKGKGKRGKELNRF